MATDLENLRFSNETNLRKAQHFESEVEVVKAQMQKKQDEMVKILESFNIAKRENDNLKL
jgi:hypothetical protein